jgi:hypothetical protein
MCSEVIAGLCCSRKPEAEERTGRQRDAPPPAFPRLPNATESWASSAPSTPGLHGLAIMVRSMSEHPAVSHWPGPSIACG